MTHTSGRPALGPLTLAAVLVVGGVVAVLTHPGTHSLAPAATDLDRLAPDVAGAIATYRTPRLVASILLRVLAVAVPVLVVTTGPGRRMLDRVAGGAAGTWRTPLRGALVAAVITLAGAMAAMPIRAWAGIIHDGDWHVRTATAVGWWGRVATVVGLDVAVMALVGAGLVVLVRRRPATWPVDLVAVGVVVVAVGATVQPALAALTTPTRPLGTGATAEAVLATLDDAGLAGLPVVVAERSRRDVRSNAVVHGLGPTRQVVVDDTLLARPVDEVVAVMAHEAGHQAARDVERGVLASAMAALAVGLLVRFAWHHPRVRRQLGGSTPLAPHDPRVVAVAIAVVAAVTPVVEPIALWQSRRVEAAADNFALDHGADPTTTVVLQRRLSIDNLHPLEVPTWQRVLWSSHPSGSERIQAAVARARQAGTPLPSRDDLLDREAADPPAWTRPR